MANEKKTWPPETGAVAEILEREEDVKFDLTDRMMHYNLLDEEAFEEAVFNLAFTLEEELRVSADHHYISFSMWKDILFPVLDKTDFKEIAEARLSKTKTARQKAIENNVK